MVLKTEYYVTFVDEYTTRAQLWSESGDFSLRRSRILLSAISHFPKTLIGDSNRHPFHIVMINYDANKSFLHVVRVKPKGNVAS